MRSGDFFAVFCIESNIGPATRNKEKSHSNPSLNIAVKIWKCEWEVPDTRQQQSLVVGQEL